MRNGLDAARGIALGADMAGVALPVLRALINNGEEGARRLLESMIYQVKTILFMTGARRVEELWSRPITIHGRLLDEAEARGIDPRKYIYQVRPNTLLWRMRNG